MSRRTRPWWVGLGLVVLLVSSQALAQDGVRRVIPYDGVLTLEGRPLDSPVTMEFTLYDSEGAVVWNERWGGGEDGARSCGGEEGGCMVPMYRSRFSVLLGTWNPITEALLDDVAVELGIELEHPVTGAWTNLTGRHALAALPYALWSSGSDDFIVADDLIIADAASLSVAAGGVFTVETDVTLEGALSGTTVVAASMHCSGDITSTGTVSVAGIATTSTVAQDDLYFTSEIQVGGNTAAVVNSSELVLNPDNDFPGGTWFRNPVQIGTRTNALYVSNTVRIDDTLIFDDGSGNEVGRLDGNRAIVRLHYIDNCVADTESEFGVSGCDSGISTSDWTCGIGGYAIDGGRFGTTPATLISLIASPSMDGSTWIGDVSWLGACSTSTTSVLFVCTQAGLDAGS